MKPLLITVLVLTAVGAGGCARNAGDVQPAAGLPADRTFLSTSVTEDGKDRPLVRGTRIRLTIDNERLSVDAGCNSLSGNARLDGDRLVVDNMGGTEMGCEPELADQDSWLSGFLTGGPSWRLEGDTLRLTMGGTTIELLDRPVADPDRPLRETNWQLDTLVDGETASSLPGEAKAHITFGENGRATGNAGCNDFSAQFEEAGEEITFSAVTTTRKSCGGTRDEVEQAVLAVLEASPTYEIVAGRLRLAAPSGNELGFHEG
ncbi:MAG: META domain-containing protein [Actinophytocola sp.]|nr:META domain-containing protein [Actinophytocola sp.]